MTKYLIFLKPKVFVNINEDLKRDFKRKESMGSI